MVIALRLVERHANEKYKSWNKRFFVRPIMGVGNFTGLLLHEFVSFSHAVFTIVTTVNKRLERMVAAASLCLLSGCIR